MVVTRDDLNTDRLRLQLLLLLLLLIPLQSLDVLRGRQRVQERSAATQAEAVVQGNPAPDTAAVTTPSEFSLGVDHPRRVQGQLGAW